MDVLDREPKGVHGQAYAGVGGLGGWQGAHDGIAEHDGSRDEGDDAGCGGRRVV